MSSTDRKKRKAPEESQSTPPHTLTRGLHVPNKRRKVAPGATTNQLRNHATKPKASEETNETSGEDNDEDTPKRPVDANREPCVRSKQKVEAHLPPKTPRIIKLTPKRPSPKVGLSGGATGPRSSRKEGKNMISVTRRVALGAYLRQCVELIKVDGYVTKFRTLLSAVILMG